MLANWCLEGIKWKLLIQPVEKISLWISIKAVLAGITVSLFTPNRIGEYGGRVFVLRPQNRWKGVFATIVGSLSQLTITVMFGLFAMIVFLLKSDIVNDFHFIVSFAIILMFTLVVFSVLIFFFRVAALEKFFKIFSKKEKYLSNISIIRYYTKRKLLKVLALSTSRYFIFSLQYYLLLILFGVEINFFYGLLLIALIYFIVAVIPTFALTELGIRGSVAIFVIESYIKLVEGEAQQSATQVISASILLWIINLAIPAIAGSVVFFNMKFFNHK